MSGPERQGQVHRREFLGSAVRCTAAVGLLGATVALVVLGQDQPAKDEDWFCPQGPACRGCGEFTGCGLPKAIATRRALSEGGGRVAEG